MEPEVTARLIETRKVGTVDDSNIIKGEKQPPQCRDGFFAILFYAHLAAMAAVTFTYGKAALTDNATTGGHGNNADPSGFIWIIAIVGAMCSLLSFVSLHVMTHFAKSLIQIALLGQLTVSLFMAFGALVSGQVGGFLIGLVFFALGVCYACMVWSRIPFAAALLNTAVSGVRNNLGVTFVSYGLMAAAFVYTIIWSIGAVGVYYAQCPPNKSSDDCDIGGGYVFLLLLSLYWTLQVIQNTTHVSVAGTIATWWFAPDEASTCCSSAVSDSFVRATTLSFGSVCLGSLLVAIVQTLRAMVEQMRRQDDGIMVCIADCILGCIESYMQYFNKWAYVYVGMYGYDYCTAGKMVMELFQSRGWSSIISFDLVSGALFMASVMVGLLSGICGVIVRASFPSWFALLGEGAGMAVFWISFLVGLLLTSIMMSIVASAVNTVIVCFAEAPNEFEQNHRWLSDELRVAWRSMYPEEFSL